jgi:hypothetical protein
VVAKNANHCVPLFFLGWTDILYIYIQADEDVLMEELNDIWEAASKFPDVTGEDTRIDVDSFVQIYRDVDDLFDDEEETNDEPVLAAEKQPTETDTVEALEPETVNTEDETVEAELEQVYKSLCDKDGLVSKVTLKAWEDLQKLLDEGLLGDDEFDELWEKTPKSPGSIEQLDVDGFLSFNVALDGLFEFDDEEIDEFDEIAASPEVSQAQTPRKMVEGDDLPPGVLFAAIADEDYLVGMDELKLWSELQDMLEEGDLLPSELQNMYDKIEKTESGKLNEDGFAKIYDEIDALFEDVDEEEDSAEETGAFDPSAAIKIKKDLVSFIDIIVDPDTLPCGLDCTEKDKKQVLNIVEALERQPTNFITKKNGNVEMSDLSGTWELLYSSSSAMKFNHGLTGLGGLPNGKFAGLKMKLSNTKFLSDVEYVEHIDVIPSSASFDVTVTGSWFMRSSMSLFTGQPSITLEIEPDLVKYALTSTKGDHWKSLGPLNMLDLTYLDEDFRVMRGCTALNNVFVFKKCS